MKSRIPALAGLLAALLLLASAADAQTLYVRNRVFAERVNIAGTLYVPFEGFMQALRMDWTAQADGSMVARPGRGQGAPVTAEAFLLRCEDRSLVVEARVRDGAVWVPLRPVAETLGFTVLFNKDTGDLDVVAGRPYNEADREAEAALEAARSERQKAIEEAWAARREKIQAERKAREEAADAKAAEGAEAGTEAAATPGGGEGTFPPEMAGKTGAEKKPEAEKKPAEETPAAEATPATEEKPAAEEKPKKPEPKADLLVISPRALPDYFTGRVQITARIQNNGEADATGVRARVTLKGPDGSVWNTESLYRDKVKVDEVWNLETSWTHLAGASMPRGVPTVLIDLDYSGK